MTLALVVADVAVVLSSDPVSSSEHDWPCASALTDLQDGMYVCM